MNEEIFEEKNQPTEKERRFGSIVFRFSELPNIFVLLYALLSFNNGTLTSAILPLMFVVATITFIIKFYIAIKKIGFSVPLTTGLSVSGYLYIFVICAMLYAN